MKSRYSRPVSFLTLTLPTAGHSTVGHGDERGPTLREVGHVALDGLPDVEDLAAPKRADIVDPLDEDGVLQPGQNGPGLIVDALSELLGGKIRAHWHCPLMIWAIE